MSTRTRKHPNPAGGPWAWRDYLPNTIDEWLLLRDRAVAHEPNGVDVARFADWTLAEMRSQPLDVGVSTKTEAKYRRLLFELQAEPEPAPVKRTARHLRAVTADKARTDDAGAGDLASVFALAMSGGIVLLALALANPWLLLGTPVILEEQSYVELPGELIVVDFGRPALKKAS